MSDATPVVVFRIWDAVPTWHRWAIDQNTVQNTVETPLDDGTVRVENQWTTACGRVHGRWGWTRTAAGSHRSVDGSFWEERGPSIRIRRDHAEMIGRECQKCRAT